MSASATFCNIPLSTSFNPNSEKSLLALEWILSSGLSARDAVASGVLSLHYTNTSCSMHINLNISPSLPYDLVLGRDWSLICHDSLPNASCGFSSGIVRPGLRTASSLNTPQACSMDIDTEAGDAEPVIQVKRMPSERA
ncbi:hypothetical protein DFH09DRAFT_1319078 [Mycena vulgaris]|nr:hypothetical protein DFH09DRAFT_1319078 [Mycena vulgaris]